MQSTGRARTTSHRKRRARARHFEPAGEGSPFIEVPSMPAFPRDRAVRHLGTLILRDEYSAFCTLPTGSDHHRPVSGSLGTSGPWHLRQNLSAVGKLTPLSLLPLRGLGSKNHAPKVINYNPVQN
jgi:hypothetical protein